MILFPSTPVYTPSDYRFKIARSSKEREAYFRLRRQVFCNEQSVFFRDDRDEIDERAIPIVCTSILAGMEDEVVGVVRIDEREPGIWYGSRLAVSPQFRRVRHLSPGVEIRNHQPAYRGLGSLGAGLIYKAVSTANRIGCDAFFATVQHQNVRFFRRLHWTLLDECELHGMRHARMQADLDHYPAAYDLV